MPVDLTYTRNVLPQKPRKKITRIEFDLASLLAGFAKRERMISNNFA
jgi:hypothetical protein